MLQKIAPIEEVFDPNVFQRQASDPEASVWVSASAGSGKTKVLTDRVLRLLLSGYLPHKILCLTFTKAAAAEMQERVKSKLRDWSQMSEIELIQALSDLTGQKVSATQLEIAATLYDQIQYAAQSVRIQTIHAFCQSLLKQFPIEANISPHFEPLDDRDSKALLEASFKTVMAGFNIKEGLFDQADIQFFSQNFSLDQFYELSEKVVSQKEYFLILNQTYSNLEQLKKAYYDFFECDHASYDAFFEFALQTISEFDLKKMAIQFQIGASSDQTKAEKIKYFLENPAVHFKHLITAFLTQKNALRKNLVTQKLDKTYPGFLEEVTKLGEQLRWIEDRLKAYKTADSSYHYAKFACLMIQQYEQKKQEKHVLDFDDLILKTANLLENSEALDWVLYKLDSGIDHILVDEAQDTNLNQWRIVIALVNEFFSGLSVSEENRTIFVVGDEKQSIYSFQGASPIIFSKIKQDFREKVIRSGKLWRDIKLDCSFRSTSAVLDVVDDVFSKRELQNSVISNQDEMITHQAYRADAYGKVSLWPLVTDEQTAKNLSAFQSPLVKNYTLTASKKHAKLIAKTIKKYLLEARPLISKKRPVEPQDIMILLRRRNHFFHEIVTALKQETVPVTGVDRMVLKNQLCIEDLIAFGKWLLFPDDDLNLACLLKSPLIGLNDDDLFTLAYGREKTLWVALKTNIAYQSYFDYLNSFLKQIDLLAPSALFHQILNHPCPAHTHSGYKAFLSRLGYESEDPIDEFLALLHFYEKRHSRSLELFISWFEKDNTQIKRDVNHTNHAVQIMTVHGSKGLQAPIVILPDTVSVPRMSNKIFWQKIESCFLPIYTPFVADSAASLDRIKALEKASQLSEYYRLLYVALTRAEDELLVTGHVGKTDPSEFSWYAILSQSLEKIGEIKAYDTHLEPGYVYEKGATEGIEKSYKTTLSDSKTHINYPDWLTNNAEKENVTQALIRPSQEISSSEAKKLDRMRFDESKKLDRIRFERGNFIHKLLETLPSLNQAMWPKFIPVIVDEFDTDSFEIDEIVQKIKRLIEHPDYQQLFSDRAIAEMLLIGEIDGVKISAQLDRVLITEKEILFIDYKTNRQVPIDTTQIPEAYQKQMSYYDQLLSKKYPDHEIKGGILWFETMELMTIDQ